MNKLQYVRNQKWDLLLKNKNKNWNLEREMIGKLASIVDSLVGIQHSKFVQPCFCIEALCFVFFL
jgi:hypothetical protein